MNSGDKKQFGNSIRLLRREQKFSQAGLATILKVKQSTISRWESGTDQPNLQNMATLVDLFKCSYDELIRGKSQDDPEELKFLHTYRSLSDEKKKKLLKFIEEIL